MTRDVVVLGAGYAGLSAARRLARATRRHDVQVTVVDPSERFTERIRLHQVATGSSLSVRPLRHLVERAGARLITASVTAIDLNARRVLVTNGPPLAYDDLIVATGSHSDRDAVPGALEHAHTVDPPRQAHRLFLALTELLPGAQVAVVGGGLTGIETAAEIAAHRTDLSVHLVSSHLVGGWLSHRGRKHVRASLERLGVNLIDGVQVAAVEPQRLRCTDGSGVASDLTVWTAGFVVSPLARESGLSVDGSGRMIVDQFLRSVSHPEVYGVGDAASVAGPGTRMSCQTAIPMGRHAAADVARRVRGRPAHPFTMRHVWQNISLGRDDALTQFTRADDSPLPYVVTGRRAAWFKEQISRSAAWTATQWRW